MVISWRGGQGPDQVRANVEWQGFMRFLFLSFRLYRACRRVAGVGPILPSAPTPDPEPPATPFPRRATPSPDLTRFAEAVYRSGINDTSPAGFHGNSRLRIKPNGSFRPVEEFEQFHRDRRLMKEFFVQWGSALRRGSREYELATGRLATEGTRHMVVPLMYLERALAAALRNPDPLGDHPRWVEWMEEICARAGGRTGVSGQKNAVARRETP